MKNRMTVKKWQLIRWRAKEEEIDLGDADFVAIGKRVFFKNRVVEEICFPSSLSAIKTEAFRGCDRLQSVTLPPDNNVGLARYAFGGCVRLGRVENTELLSAIGDRAFENCYRLANPTFGRDLRRIGEYAFHNCVSLTDLTLPSCLSGVGRGAFFGCTELSRVVLEDGLTAIGKEIFRDCISLSDVTFSSTLHEIPSGAFRGCSALTSMVIPSQITKIGAKAFSECARLEDVTIEMGTVSIGAGAFAKNRRLKTVTAPHTLKRFGLGAFGFGFSREKVQILVDNEYMKRRLTRQLRLSLSAGRAEVIVVGKSIEERKRERRRSDVEQKPTHLF